MQACSLSIPIPAAPVLFRERGTLRILVATYGVGREEGRVAAFDSRGRLVWGPHPAGGNVRGTPALVNDTLYVAGGGNATANQLGTLEAYSAVGGTAPKSRMLVAGGYGATGVAPPTAEVYDGATGTWSATANTIAYGTIPTNGICSANMALLGNGCLLYTSPSPRDS